jgi:EF-P beta-lysylation protein EpmB
MALAKANDWQTEYRLARMTISDLLAKLNLDAQSMPFESDTESPFPVMVPPHFLSLIERGNPLDPLLLQVIARIDERKVSKAASQDPLEEEKVMRSDKVVQKYSSRVLLMPSGACAIHCRYCFRRHYDYGQMTISSLNVERIVDGLRENSAIREVILSGGDPFSITDEKVENLLAQLSKIDSLLSIRFHTRTLTAVPSRVTSELLRILKNCPKRLTIVLHTNHPNELDSIVGEAIRLIRDAGVHVMNQAVLLARVNSCADTLQEHSWRLHSFGILPYYIHLLDAVAGGEHFEVPLEEAFELQSSLRARLPGYLVPRFVREVPGAPNKTPLEQLVAHPEREFKRK